MNQFIEFLKENTFLLSYVTVITGGITFLIKMWLNKSKKQQKIIESTFYNIILPIQKILENDNKFDTNLRQVETFVYYLKWIRNSQLEYISNTFNRRLELLIKKRRI